MADISPLDPTIQKRFSQLYFTYPWSQLRNIVNQDPQLRDVYNYIRTSGYDPDTFIRDIPMNRSGAEVGGRSSLRFQNMYGKLGTVTTADTGTLGGQNPASAQQVKQTVTNLQQTAPGPNPTPGIPAVSPELRAQTGVGFTNEGKNITAPGGASISLESGLNRFNPELAKKNLEELQLARLPTGGLQQVEEGAQAKLAQQAQASIKAGQPNSAAVSQEEQMRLQSPFRIRQQAMQRFQQGLLKPAV